MKKTEKEKKELKKIKEFFIENDFINKKAFEKKAGISERSLTYFISGVKNRYLTAEQIEKIKKILIKIKYN